MNQNIYITNSEEIKEGNYGILGKEVLSYHQMHKRWGMPQGDKIILTTDQDLIKNGVQAIDDEFLEWFVKNPSCEYIKTEKWLDDEGKVLYSRIIPKEEPKQVGVDWSKFPKSTQEKVGYVEPKQETLEEVMNKNGYQESDYDKIWREGVEFGAKWQQEQILDFLYSEITERRDYSASKMCEKVIEFIEQFKNK